MNSQFTVCTYNIGSSVNDYFLHCKYHNPSLNFTSEEEDKQFRAKYDATQVKTAQLLENQADVYCLQEVGNTNRPMYTSLLNKGFQFVRYDNDRFDTAIALNPKRFIDITNHSIDVQITKYFKKDVAIATAIDIQSGQRVAFVSAHVPGFNFMKIEQEEVADGDLYCRAITQKLSQIGPSTIQIIGADMNANPEKWNPRFQTFSQRGLKVLRTNDSTNVNPKDSQDQKREIDFIFATSLSFWQKIKSIFCKSVQSNATIKAFNPLGWDIDNNASDHLPVFVDVKPTVNNSKIYQLLSSICSIFSCCTCRYKSIPQHN